MGIIKGFVTDIVKMEVVDKAIDVTSKLTDHMEKRENKKKLKKSDNPEPCIIVNHYCEDTGSLLFHKYREGYAFYDSKEQLIYTALYDDKKKRSLKIYDESSVAIGSIKQCLIAKHSIMQSRKSNPASYDVSIKNCFDGQVNTSFKMKTLFNVPNIGWKMTSGIKHNTILNDKDEEIAIVTRRVLSCICDITHYAKDQEIMAIALTTIMLMYDEYSEKKDEKRILRDC